MQTVSVRHISDNGAKPCCTAVFANKLIKKTKPIKADYVSLDVPDHHMLGFGMNAKQMGHNLGAIYTMK